MEQSGISAFGLVPFVPVMTRERFAELSGLGPDVVRGMMDRGHLPTLKVGRHRLVNVSALSVSCLDDAAGETGDDDDLPGP